MMNKVILAFIFISGFGIGFYVKGRSPDGNIPGAVPSAVSYVHVSTPLRQNVSPKITNIARVEALNSVNIKSQVTGIITDIFFEEGSFVKEGDILFVIDKDKYQADVEAKEAIYKKEKANQVQTERSYKRKQELYKGKHVSTAALEEAESSMLQAKAAVSEALANLKLAQIDLANAEIKAPISGFISKALVTKGNYVDSSSTTLARIVQRDPVRIKFSITDKDRLHILKTLKNLVPQQQSVDLGVALADGTILNAPVTKSFTGSEADDVTGTLDIYVEYDNKDDLLVPGNYVDIVFQADRQNVLTVPVLAVSQDSNGKYVMVVTDDNVAEQRYIELGENVDDYYVVDNGLQETDRIITQGIQKIKNGQPVKIISTPSE